MIFTVSGRQLASSKWKVKLLSPPMYLQLQKRQGAEHYWMSKNNFSSLSCVVRKAWRCSAAEALLTVLARPSARPFGPDDSPFEAQKRCKGWTSLFSHPGHPDQTAERAAAPSAQGPRCSQREPQCPRQFVWRAFIFQNPW